MLAAQCLTTSLLALTALLGVVVAAPSWGPPVFIYQRPIDAMVDITNDLGVAVLQDHVSSRSNFAFSPYGVASVLVLLYEGARGESALQIHNALRFPWERDVTRIGFRDIHRHLRTYFSHEGYLSGITLSKNATSLLPEYQRVLRFYGYDVSKAPMTGQRPPAGDVPVNATSPASVTMKPVEEEAVVPVNASTATPVTIMSESSTVEDVPITTASPAPVTMKPREEEDVVPVNAPTAAPVTIMSESSTVEDVPITTTSPAPVTMKPREEEDVVPVNVPTAAPVTAMSMEEDTPLDPADETDQSSVTAMPKEDAMVEGVVAVPVVEQEEITMPGDSAVIPVSVTSPSPMTTKSKEEEVTVAEDKPDLPANALTPPPVTEKSEHEESAIAGDGTVIPAKMSPMPGAPTTQTSELSSPEITTTISSVEKGSPITTSSSTTTMTTTTTREESVVITFPSTKQEANNEYESTTPSATVYDLDMSTVMSQSTDDVKMNASVSAAEVDVTTLQPEAVTSEDTTLSEIEVTTEMAEQLTMTPEALPALLPVRMPATYMPGDVEAAAAFLPMRRPTDRATTRTPVETAESREDVARPPMTGVEAILGAMQSLMTEPPEYEDEDSESISGESTSADDTGDASVSTTTSDESTASAGGEVTSKEEENGSATTSSSEEVETTSSDNSAESSEGVTPTEADVRGESESTPAIAEEATTKGTVDSETVTMALGDSEVTTVSSSEDEQLTTLADEVTVTLPAAVYVKTLVDASNQSDETRAKRALSDPGGLDYPDISLQLQNGMYGSHVARGDALYTQLPKHPFLVDGVTEELVPVMSYTSVFPYAYVPRIHALALEFPLDDERYKLLLLLPVERRGLRQLIYDLSSCPLREVYRTLKPTRVRAVIPSFMVEGFVILTSTLQQLGIWDVFDPRRSDLSGMSSDPELYVRNIEQSITVVIRNYVEIVDIQTRTMAARGSPERFQATHPFLYFVVDAETHVSLMAGKIVDPLNSRIY